MSHTIFTSAFRCHFQKFLVECGINLLNFKYPENHYLFSKGDRETDLKHYNFKNKANTLKELGTHFDYCWNGCKESRDHIFFLQFFFHCGKNTWGTLILVQVLVLLTSYMPLGKDQELFQSLICPKDTTLLP